MRILSKDNKTLIFVEEAVSVHVEAVSYSETFKVILIHGETRLLIDYFETEIEAMDFISTMSKSANGSLLNWGDKQ